MDNKMDNYRKQFIDSLQGIPNDTKGAEAKEFLVNVYDNYNRARKNNAQKLQNKIRERNQNNGDPRSRNVRSDISRIIERMFSK